MTFSSRQLKILIRFSFLLVAMGLYPPWTYTFDAQSIHSEKPAGYDLIFTPPLPERDAPAFGVRMDISRLLIQWFVLAAATTAVVLLEKKT